VRGSPRIKPQLPSKASNKPDPLDCTYVRKCVIDLLRKGDDFVRFKGLLGMLDGKLG